MYRMILLSLVLTVGACSGSSGSGRSDDPATGTSMSGSSSVPEGMVVPDGDSFEVDEDEVEFESRSAKLTGAILRPRHDGPAKAGVVVVHDYGPHGRDGLMDRAFGVSIPVEVPVYRSIAEDLAARGYAVLIYEKRTCVETNEAWCKYPVSYLEQADGLGAALLDDALAAAGALKAKTGVESVHWVGHGQGAELAVIAATKMGGRVAMLAPSAHALDEIVLWQTRRSREMLEARIAEVGDTAEADLLKKELDGAALRLDDHRSKFGALRAGTRKEETHGLSATTWRGYFALHDAFVEALAEKEPKTLAVVGAQDRDYPDDSARKLEAVSSGAVVIVEGLSHMMVSLDDDADPTIVAPVVHEHIASFFDAQP